MTKKLMTALLTLLALTACQDEPNKSSVEKITVNGVSFNMVKVEGGSVTLNMEYLLWGQFPYYQDSTLNVTVEDFSIGQTEVTQALWLAVMGENPSYFSSNNGYNGHVERVFEDDLNRPVERVSWDDCQDFISKLNELTGRHFRLPAEAEWEFAARGGNKTHGYTYAGSNDIDAVAWYCDNSDMTHPVGQKAPNELGIYDMSGNVTEWCSDLESFGEITHMGFQWYHFRIFRGGTFASNSDWCTVWRRQGQGQESRSNFMGLRLAE
ncbi:MAG: formylglycine-generating enzyme family protein [Muribaculaceae bacterium]|nr:formylglycine-generating enzyme family protein [Muribaculaceae bacterium]